MRYVVARFNQHQRDMAYRFYLCECERIISENTSKAAQILGKGKIECSYIDKPFKDLVYPKKEKQEPTFDDVINELKSKGLEVID